MDTHNDQSMYGANRVIERVPCPRCRAGGGDRAGDNKHIYGDGHTHCFGCGTHEHAPILSQIERLVRQAEPLIKWPDFPELDFPEDFMPLASALYAKEAYSWIKGYGITEAEIVKHKIGWSSKRRLLVFPVFGESGHLLMWQGRNFGEGTKYVTKGQKCDTIVGNPAHGPNVIVVEDFISAVKVGRSFHAMPLWGCSMTLETLRKLSERYKEVGLWLDDNKTRDAVKLALRGSQYVPTFVISTPGDPKSYSDDMIKAFVMDARKEMVVNEPAPKKQPAEPLRKHYSDGRIEEIDSETGEVLKVVQTAGDVTFRWPFADRPLEAREVRDIRGQIVHHQDVPKLPPLAEETGPFSWESRLHRAGDHIFSYRKSDGGS